MIDVSLLMLTLDRFELTKQVLTTNLNRAESKFRIELLVSDNGSSDKRIVDWISERPELTYHRVNSRNEGCAKAFNQLYLRSMGDYICLLGNDIEMPMGWLAEMVKYASGVPNSGIIGMDWGHNGLPPLTQKFGIHAHWLTPVLDKIFGVWMMRRQVIEKIGLFHEGFGHYGLEDSDFNNRVNIAGFNSCYVPNTHFKSKHLGTDNHDKGEYRQMKNQSLQNGLAVLSARMQSYQTKGIVEPLPETRDPI